MEYIEHDKQSQNKSSVWSHFLRSKIKTTAKCKHCNKVLMCSGGSTSSLRNHLKKTHLISLTDVDTIASSSSTHSVIEQMEICGSNIVQSPTSKKPQKQTISEYFTRQEQDSMELTISRMVTLDGLPFRVFANSADLIRLFKNNGHSLPTSANTIKNIVIKQSEVARQKIIAELSLLTKKGHKFSATADEWTSTRNRRYMNINIHSPFLKSPKKFVNLGLARLEGSATALKCAQTIENRLKMYHLQLEDLTGLTTDGASVMVKMGRDLPVYHQLCYAHAIQLAILDVLYKDKSGVQNSIEHIPVNNFNGSESDSDEDELDGISFEQDKRPVRLCSNYKHIIDKVRRTVKIFRKSPTKNDEVLQRYVLEEFGKDLSLQLDCKTRWSSMCNMLQRFIKLYYCIQKSLIDLKSDIRFTEEEVSFLKHVHEVLDVLKSVVEVLCQEDATLLTADVALKHMYMKLAQIDGELSNALQNTLRKRIGERYLTVQGVLRYLDNANDFFKEDLVGSIFEKPSPESIRSVIMYLGAGKNKPGTTDGTDTLELESEKSPSEGLDQKFLTFKEELLHKIKSTTKTNASTSTPLNAEAQKDDCVPEMIICEMALHENGGDRGKFLTRAYNYLLTIKPTSVESERAFSTAGYFCNKLRSRLNDSTLDALMMLRSYFLSQKHC